MQTGKILHGWSIIDHLYETTGHVWVFICEVDICLTTISVLFLGNINSKFNSLIISYSLSLSLMLWLLSYSIHNWNIVIFIKWLIWFYYYFWLIIHSKLNNRYSSKNYDWEEVE